MDHALVPGLDQGEFMADLRYLRERAAACREAARVAGDQREATDLRELAKVYDHQVQQCSQPLRQRG